jgi:hypothetical protein
MLRVRPIAATLVAAFVLASTARAQVPNYAPPPPPIVYAPSPYPPPQPFYYAPPVPLRLEGDAPGMQYEVLGPKGDDRVFGRCTAPCTLQLAAGTYRVRVQGESIPSKQQSVVLEGSTRVYSEAGSSSGKTGGLVLAITGTALAGIGLAVAVLASMEGSCSMSECGSSASAQRRRDEANTTAGTALVVAGVGALLGTVGWITFASNRTKMHVGDSRGPGFSLGAAPTSGGASFGIVGTF